jgi:hypothetical protein
MKMKFLLIMLMLIGSAHADPFPKGNVAAGKRTFEQTECKRCHIEVVSGDGSEIFTRADRIALNPALLMKQIKINGPRTGFNLTAQDELNLAAYLNKVYYKFP